MRSTNSWPLSETALRRAAAEVAHVVAHVRAARARAASADSGVEAGTAQRRPAALTRTAPALSVRAGDDHARRARRPSPARAHRASARAGCADAIATAAVPACLAARLRPATSNTTRLRPRELLVAVARAVERLHVEHVSARAEAGAAAGRTTARRLRSRRRTSCGSCCRRTARAARSTSGSSRRRHGAEARASPASRRSPSRWRCRAAGAARAGSGARRAVRRCGPSEPRCP